MQSLHHSKLFAGRLEASGLGKSRLSRSQRPATELAAVPSLLQQCVTHMRAHAYAEANDSIARINDYEGTIPLNPLDIQKAWIFRLVTSVALGEASVDASEMAMQSSDNMDMVELALKEILGSRTMEGVEKWFLAKSAGFLPERRPELAMSLYNIRMYGLVIDILENHCQDLLLADDAMAIFYVASSALQLGLRKKAEQYWKRLPVDDKVSPAYTSMVALGVSIYVKAELFQDAHALLQSAETSGQYHDEALTTLKLRRAQVSKKLKQYSAVCNTINGMTISETDSHYLSAQLLLAQCSSPENAQQIYRHLLSPSFQRQITDANVTRTIKLRELKTRLANIVSPAQLVDYVKSCSNFIQEYATTQESAFVIFLRATATLQLHWFDSVPNARALPSAPSFVPFTPHPSSIISHSRGGRMNTAVKKPLSVAPLPLASPSTMTLPNGKSEDQSSDRVIARATVPLGLKQGWWEEAMDKFEVALLQIGSARKLAVCYKMMLKQHIYVITAEEVARLMKVAQKYLDKAHRLEPREPNSACLYAEQLRLGGRLKEAEALLKALDRNGTVDLELLLCRGVRDPASAIPELKGLHAPGLEITSQFHCGRLYEAQGKFREADMEYSSLLERERLHMPTLYRKAHLLLSRLNSPHLACIHINTILAHFPHDIEILECKINALMSLGRHWDASNALRELSRIEPLHPRSYALQSLLDTLANDSSFLALAKDSAQTLSQAVLGLVGWN